MPALEKFTVEKTIEKATDNELMKEIRKRGLDLSLKQENRLEEAVEKSLKNPEKKNMVVKLDLYNPETRKHIPIEKAISFSNETEKRAMIADVRGSTGVVDLESKGYRIVSQHTGWA